MLLLILSTCLLGLVLSDHETAKFRIHVKEDSSRFDQHIEADMYKNHVYYNNPKHNNVLESRKMQDFNLGIEVFCLPEKQACFVAPLNRTIYPDATRTILSVSSMWKHGQDSADGSFAESIIHKWYAHDEFDFENSGITQELKDFIHVFGFPVYEIRQIPENSEILQGEIPANWHEPSHKRQLITSDKRCSNNATPRSRFGYTGTRNCDYLYFCDEAEVDGEHTQVNLPTNCKQTHVQAFTYYTCLCCPDQHTVHDCLYCHKLWKDHS